MFICFNMVTVMSWSNSLKLAQSLYRIIAFPYDSVNITGSLRVHSKELALISPFFNHDSMLSRDTFMADHPLSYREEWLSNQAWIFMANVSLRSCKCLTAGL